MSTYRLDLYQNGSVTPFALRATDFPDAAHEAEYVMGMSPRLHRRKGLLYQVDGGHDQLVATFTEDAER